MAHIAINRDRVPVAAIQRDRVALDRVVLATVGRGHVEHRDAELGRVVRRRSRKRSVPRRGASRRWRDASYPTARGRARRIDQAVAKRQKNSRSQYISIFIDLSNGVTSLSIVEPRTTAAS